MQRAVLGTAGEARAVGREADMPHFVAMFLQHLNAALKLSPNMGEAYESRGVLYVKMGKKEDAEKDLATLKQLNPKLTPGLETALKTGKDVDHYQ